ncbi:MAG: hypothetical protein J0H74_04750 [Chitinophagaceae bacterium]|nr:hypothetical protein [Chitinophagaceae bacterium]
MLLLSWLLFQYSRILNYQSCRITPLSSTPALACDCQKQPPEAAMGNNQHSTENAAFKSRPEDVFIGRYLSSLYQPICLLLPDKTDRVPMISAGNRTGIFQPPRGNVFLPLFI